MNNASFDETSIRKYAGLMKELGLTGLEVKEDNRVVRLERMENATAAQALSAQAAPAQTLSAQAAPAQAAAEAEAGQVRVSSPMVGVFYASPAENAEPFVKVGDAVRKGDTLCIIEAMKLMNEILAEEDGVVAEICARNGQVVDYGCALFRIRRDAA